VLSPHDRECPAKPPSSRDLRPQPNVEKSVIQISGGLFSSLFAPHHGTDAIPGEAPGTLPAATTAHRDAMMALRRRRRRPARETWVRPGKQMSISRRALVAGIATAAGVLAGCGDGHPARSAGTSNGPGRRTQDPPGSFPAVSTAGGPAEFGSIRAPEGDPARLPVSRAEIVGRYGALRPRAWGLRLPGMLQRLAAGGWRLAAGGGRRPRRPDVRRLRRSRRQRLRRGSDRHPAPPPGARDAVPQHPVDRREPGHRGGAHRRPAVRDRQPRHPPPSPVHHGPLGLRHPRHPRRLRGLRRGGQQPRDADRPARLPAPLLPPRHRVL